MNFLDNISVEKQLYPFTLTRAVADIRIGILTIREKWQRSIGALVGILQYPQTCCLQKKILASIKMGNDIIEGADSVLIKYPWHIFEFNDWAIRHDFALLTNRKKFSTHRLFRIKLLIRKMSFLEEGAEGRMFDNKRRFTGPVYIGRNAEVMEGMYYKRTGCIV